MCVKNTNESSLDVSRVQMKYDYYFSLYLHTKALITEVEMRSKLAASDPSNMAVSKSITGSRDANKTPKFLWVKCLCPRKKKKRRKLRKRNRVVYVVLEDT